jgi:hypothetical protein
LRDDAPASERESHLRAVRLLHPTRSDRSRARRPNASAILLSEMPAQSEIRPVRAAQGNGATAIRYARMRAATVLASSRRRGPQQRPGPAFFPAVTPGLGAQKTVDSVDTPNSEWRAATNDENNQKPAKRCGSHAPLPDGLDRIVGVEERDRVGAKSCGLSAQAAIKRSGG